VWLCELVYVFKCKLKKIMPLKIYLNLCQGGDQWKQPRVPKSECENKHMVRLCTSAKSLIDVIFHFSS